MGVFAVSLEQVRIERLGTPRVDTANTHLVQVHAKRNILVALEFPRELYVGKLFRSVMLGAEFHARVTHNH